VSAAVARLAERLGAGARGRLLVGEPLRAHTSLRVGGPADLLLFPADREDLLAALSLAAAEGVPVLVIGNGTNLLVRDGGVRGLVLHCGSLEGIRDEGPVAGGGGHGLAALAGTRLTRVINFAVKAGLSGLEFAAGIPGTVGGAVAMNAGAHGHSVGDAVAWVDLAGLDGSLERFGRDRLAFAYRSAAFPRPGIVVEVGLRLVPAPEAAVLAETKRCLEEHKRRLPFGWGNAGSVFKNPPGEAAGRLIDAAGCKGLRVGGAEVSAKHANVIVNVAQASAADIERLMGLVAERVRERSGVALEPEVKVVGDPGVGA
jgi:UDP-N-acetylmuramate dehydrogenase